MNITEIASVAVVLTATLTLYIQLRRLRASLNPRRFAQVVILLYVVAINIMALTTTDIYILRSGILSKIGVLFLLLTVMLDKGDC